MAIDPDLAPDLENFPLFVDQESRPLVPDLFSARLGFLDPHPIGLKRRAFFVRGERNGEVMLGPKFGVFFDAVFGNPEKGDARLGKRVALFGKAYCLLRAARRVILGIEEQHELLAFEIRKANWAVFTGQGKGGGFITGVKHKGPCRRIQLIGNQLVGLYLLRALWPGCKHGLSGGQ